MAWRDQLRTASFKDASFFVSSTDNTFGRRVVVHEFPKKSKPYAEDLGQRPREFNIDAFVVGADYFVARDALLAALNSEGSGKLVHPYLGTIEAVCTEVTMRESTSDGAMARFSIRFVETGEPTAPVPKIDAKSDLFGRASEFTLKAAAYFEKAWAVVGYATHVADRAVEITGAVLDKVEEGSKKVRGALNEVAELSFRIRRFRTNIRRIAATPRELAAEMSDAFALLANALGVSGSGTVPSKVMSVFFIPVNEVYNQLFTPAGTPAQVRIRENAAAMNNYVIYLTITHQSQALAVKEFSSAQEAEADRSELLAQIDLAMEDADDDMFEALQSLRVAVTKSVPPPGETLAQEVVVDVPRTTASLLVAYDTFESLDSEDDILGRNNVKNPAFILGKVKALNG